MTIDFRLVSKMAWYTVSILCAASIILAIIHAHNRKDNKFDLLDLFTDGKTGKVDGANARLNMAFIIMSWVLTQLTIEGKLTEWYITAYVGAWVVDKMFSRNAQVEMAKIPNNSGEPQ